MKKKICLSSPDITQREIDAAVRVLKTDRLSLGPELKAFEKEFASYMGAKYAIGVSSGTAGLHCLIRAFDFKEGDEIITTPFSFIASSNCILFEKARPVFVDIEEDSLCMNPDLIEAKITSKTKALLIVHVLGVSCNLSRLEAIAKKHKLIIIEDACEALGTTWQGKKVGTFGKAGVFAFYPNKQMTTGEGGMIVTNDLQVRDFCRSVRNQGRSLGSNFAFDKLGYNYRLSEIQAAVGRVQLSRISTILQKRRHVAAIYANALNGVEEVTLPPGMENESTSWFVFLIRLSKAFGTKQRDAIRKALAKDGIETAVYFPAIHLQPFYQKDLGYRKGDFPITESVSERTIALPFFNNLQEEDIRRVCESLKSKLRTPILV